MWWIAMASAADLEGFQRIWVDPAELVLQRAVVDGPAPSSPGALRIENPTTRRVEVTVGGAAIGRLAPRAIGAITGIDGGFYLVSLTGPDGERREATLETIAWRPGLTAPPAATLPGVVCPAPAK